MIAFAAGLFVGTLVGYFVACLMMAAAGGPR